MMRALRRRLALVMTALTALVLAGALAVTWQFSQQQYTASAETLFAQNFTALCDRLADAATVSDAWLAEQERASGCLLFLQDNGAALHYPGASAAQSRAALETQLWQAAAGQLPPETLGDAAVRQSVAFAIDGPDHAPYRCAAARLPRGAHGDYLLVALAQDTHFLSRHGLLTALQYAALWLAGTAILLCLCFWLAGRALAPTEQALRRQKEFIAAASHELRSPLAVIKASLQALTEQDLTAARQAQFLRSSQAEADRMARLTDDLLLLASGDAGRLSVQLRPVAPDTLCIALYDQFYPLARQSGHTLALELPEHPVPAVQADAERLQQLLAILLHNALEHTPPGTAVTLRLCAGGAKSPLSFAVSDNGPGIADADKAKIFERFYRADPSRTDKQHCGLGLAVAQELARLHGAALHVSDTPGGGATFTVQFPR